MTASCQFRQTLHIKGGEKNCSNGNSSPWCHQGYWLPVDGVHWLELELTPESLESLNTVGFFFLENETPGNCGKDSEVIFIKRLEALFSVQTVFQCLSSTFITSLVRYLLNNLYYRDPGLTWSLFCWCCIKFTAAPKDRKHSSLISWGLLWGNPVLRFCIHILLQETFPPADSFNVLLSQINYQNYKLGHHICIKENCTATLNTKKVLVSLPLGLKNNQTESEFKFFYN